MKFKFRSPPCRFAGGFLVRRQLAIQFVALLTEVDQLCFKALAAFGLLLSQAVAEILQTLLGFLLARDLFTKSGLRVSHRFLRHLQLCS